MVGYVEEQQIHQDGAGGAEELCLAHPADPIVLELNRLQNQLIDKERELGIAQGEIKGLKSTEAHKDKALEELRNEVHKLDEKLGVTQNLLDQKNLEAKKLVEDKKDALAAQYAAEATLRRVYADQKDDDSLPIESIIAPFEADIKMHKNEILALQEDKKALERLNKAKESALLEAERILRSALERALIVEEVQNQNYELRRQIEICQEENKILEKTNRQKVLEVERLSKTIQELEEIILASGAAANAIRDYKRKISELNDEKRTLERELARAKVSANRVATVVANEWKDDNDKVMPVKQWLEARRLLQAEMQKLRDKLAISERTAKAEAQLKEKLKLRLKTLEEGLKQVSTHPSRIEKSSNILGFLTNNSGLRKRSSSQPRGSTIDRSSPSKQSDTEVSSLRIKNADGEYLLRRNLWTSRSKVVNSSGKENNETKANMVEDNNNQNGDLIPSAHPDSEDMVSGFLYDRLQKEVINLRKCCTQKDDSLNAKDEEIKILMKKVGALTKALEVETKKAKREAAVREKEGASTYNDDSKRIGNSHFSKSRLAKAY